MTTEERQKARANIEVAIVATLKACSDDADAIAEHLSSNDLPLPTIVEMLEASGSAMRDLRRLRELAEADIRADAIESAERMTG